MELHPAMCYVDRKKKTAFIFVTIISVKNWEDFFIFSFSIDWINYYSYKVDLMDTS